ncbi:hypothetical protein MMALV_13280 [Candidatus Methanomethylophilus alvi Mx1201]|uniref:Uncharacterized protein n=1 Tax=Methanomethylophilus alvi (strain Mx1201) TaxID=1236689 RepID=M9SKR7_METAX|nr:hypothetical protein MMALV_13280 [Candidatus Methanomethylophilus alvi Mx1201]
MLERCPCEGIIKIPNMFGWVPPYIRFVPLFYIIIIMG